MDNLITFLVASQIVFFPILLVDLLVYPMVGCSCLIVDYHHLTIGYHYSTVGYHYLTVGYHYLTVGSSLVGYLRLLFVVVFVFLTSLDNIGKMVG